MKPIEIVGWRVDREQEVIKSQVLNGIVIRAPTVYGRGQGILEPLFRAAVKDSKVAWYGRQGGKLPTVHQDDIADCEYTNS